MNEIQRGRPEYNKNRSESEQSVYDFLDGLGVEYYRLDHEEAATMEACAAVDEALGVKMCKNLFLTNRQQTVFYLLLMPGDKPFKTKDISAQIGCARLSFASPEQMSRYLGVTPGSATVLALKNDRERAVNLLIDKQILSEEYLGCHPCVNTASVKLKTQDLLQKILPATGHSAQTVTL